MPAKFVSPSVILTAFNCPHCHTLTTQSWFSVWALYLGNSKTPKTYTLSSIDELVDDGQMHESIKRGLIAFRDYIVSMKPMIDTQNNNSKKSFSCINNVKGLAISNCMECNTPSIWLHGSLIYPHTIPGIEPNHDLPSDIRSDIEEARSIINQSPRGAAALLRLALQKICKHLGGKGKNINEDIGILVSKGLDQMIQQSLDIVRVIGNEAVHPGVMDLRDDRDTALRLIQIINIIAERCITYPKQVNELFNSLPPDKLREIEQRNNKMLPPTSIA